MNSIENELLNTNNSESMKLKFKKRRTIAEEKIRETEKEIYNLTNKKSSYELQPEVLRVFQNPLTIWNIHNVETKQLLLKVMFGWCLLKSNISNLRTPNSPLPMRLFNDNDSSDELSCPKDLELRSYIEEIYDNRRRAIHRLKFSQPTW